MHIIFKFLALTNNKILSAYVLRSYMWARGTWKGFQKGIGESRQVIKVAYHLLLRASDNWEVNNAFSIVAAYDSAPSCHQTLLVLLQLNVVVSSLFSVLVGAQNDICCLWLHKIRKTMVS